MPQYFSNFLGRLQLHPFLSLFLLCIYSEKEKNGQIIWLSLQPLIISSVVAHIQTIVLSYLLIINLIAFVLYGIDKKRALRNEYRISERVLLWIARLGGAIGSWLGIKLFRHKTKHTKFRIIVPLWMIIWLVAIVLAALKLR